MKHENEPNACNHENDFPPLSDRAKRSMACVNACQGIENPEETVPELVEALGIMTNLVEIAYGNLEAAIYAEILKARAALAKAKEE